MKPTLVFIWIFVMLFSITSADQSTRLGRLDLLAPVPLDKVKNITRENVRPGDVHTTFPAINYFEASKKVTVIGLPRIVIENNCIIAWEFDYIEKAPSVIKFIVYNEVERPFLLKNAGLSIDQITEISLSHVKREVPEFDHKPIHLNVVKDKNGDDVVYGLWYLQYGGPYHRYDSTNRKFVASYNRAQYSMVRNRGVISFPQSIYQKEIDRSKSYARNKDERRIVVADRSSEVASVDAILKQNKTESQVVDDSGLVTMPSVRVRAEWAEIQPVLDKGIISYVRVVHVLPDSPFARAGIKKGDRIIRIQEYDLRGMTEDKFAKIYDELIFRDVITITLENAFKRERVVNIHLRTTVAAMSP